MMTLARDVRGMTQAELASRLGIGQGTLSKYENGIIEPPEEFVQELSDLLNFSSRLFYERGRPYGFPPFHFRKRKKLSAKALNKIVAEMNLRRMHIATLHKSVNEGKRKTIPEIDIDDYSGYSKESASIEDIASHIREFLDVPPGPVESMVELIERFGAIVIPCDFGTDLIDAMSQRIDGLPILFFINSKSPTDRVRFTLAHELGHMILHTLTLKDDDQMESEADLFASAFLVPRKEFKHQLKKFDLRQLANLKLYWKVSMASLAMRADQLDLITPYQKKMFFMEMGKLGYRKREPHNIEPEEPGALRELVRFHHENLGYSTEELAELLYLSPEEFKQMYGDGIRFGATYGHLRVVN